MISERIAVDRGVDKFDAARASEYAEQARIALAGYDACHELSACVISAALNATDQAQVLVVGAGGGASEIVAMARLGAHWRFTAVDPSASMLAITEDAVHDHQLDERTQFVRGYVADLAPDAVFDAAVMIGVIHHVEGEIAKKNLLEDIARHLHPHAPLIVAGNRYAYESRPLLLKAWAKRWRMTGAGPEEIHRRHAKILDGAEPPASDMAMVALFEQTGFESAELFFSSLFWGAWVCRLGADRPCTFALAGDQTSSISTEE